MDNYIPTQILEVAINALHDQLEVYTKKKIKQEELLVSYEEVELKNPWSTMPTLYKIRLKNKDSSNQFHAFGVWTENGQRIEIL